jgi:hypothetical protein
MSEGTTSGTADSRADDGVGSRRAGPVGLIICMTLFAMGAVLLITAVLQLWRPVPPTRAVPQPPAATQTRPGGADTAATQQRSRDTISLAQDTAVPGQRTDSPAAGVRQPIRPDSVAQTDSRAALCAGLARDTTSTTQCVSVLVFEDRPITAEQRLLLLVVLAGALGSLLHALRSMGWYIGQRELRWSWIAYYAAMPFTGAILGFVFYVVVRAGFFSQASPSGSENLFGFVAVAALVGLFSQQAVAKLKEIAETILTKPETGKDPAAGAEPAVTAVRVEARAAGAAADALVVTGTGFTARSSVEVNGESKSCQLRGANELVVALTEQELVRVRARELFAIVVKNPDGKSSRPFEFRGA